MGTYTQADFDINSNDWSWMFGLYGYGQTVYTNVTFPEDVKLSSMGMQVGQAYGHTTGGAYVPPQGRFYGRYCVWDNSGNLLCQTDVVSQDQYSSADPNRPYTWSDFTSKPVLKKNTTYRIGYYAASETTTYDGGKVRYARSYTAKKNPNNHSRYNEVADISHNTIESGAGNIGHMEFWDTWNGYHFGMIFSVNYEKATQGAREWNGSIWNPKGIKRWNGSDWEDVPLNKWNGSSWDEV